MQVPTYRYAQRISTYVCLSFMQFKLPNYIAVEIASMYTGIVI